MHTTNPDLDRAAFRALRAIRSALLADLHPFLPRGGSLAADEWRARLYPRRRLLALPKAEMVDDQWAARINLIRYTTHGRQAAPETLRDPDLHPTVRDAASAAVDWLAIRWPAATAAEFGPRWLGPAWWRQHRRHQ